MQKQSRPAFTLVELLVVIGIIALLISILLPALNKARAQANVAKCAANMRSAVQALHIYTTEYRGWLAGPHTSGRVWKSGSGTIQSTDTSSDDTPLQNMDWVSPTLGKSFSWPQNDYERLKVIFNLQLNCPANTLSYDGLFAPGPLTYKAGDLAYASYSAVIQFHAFPQQEKSDPNSPPIEFEMYKSKGSDMFEARSSYAPQISKIGSPAKKVYLVEGARYVETQGSGTFDAVGFKTTFNPIRYQDEGGNFMIGGPVRPWEGTGYQLGGGAYTSKKLSPAARTHAWRHTGKMNLAFFDGHVELRTPSESIQADLYFPKGSILRKANLTYDPNDKNNTTID
jgi:prepilin-type processing-associated H-X9-DG protein/prepilin-type N-terminal cleavage/methylation domain-containing protein